MKRIIVLSILFSGLFLTNGISQTYKTYDQALEGFKAFAKNKGFKAVENKYDHCKHLKSAMLRKTDEHMNEFTQRMDLEITYDYQYLGCYWKIDKYNGAAKISGYIVRTQDGRYKYGFRGTEVLNWDRDD